MDSSVDFHCSPGHFLSRKTNLSSILIPRTRLPQHRRNTRETHAATSVWNGTTLPWENLTFLYRVHANTHALLNSLRWYTSDLRQPCTIKHVHTQRASARIHQPSSLRYCGQTLRSARLFPSFARATRTSLMVLLTR